MKRKACKLGVVEWKSLNFGGYGAVYEASNTGQIRRIGQQTPMRSHKVGKGYLMLELFHRGVPVRAYIHRLIAMTFVTNPDNKPYVNHIDGCKANNRADNLEWCTMDENNAHALATGLNHASKRRGTYNTGTRSPMCKR